MNEVFTLIVPGPIRSWERARSAHGHFYVPKRSKEWREKIQKEVWKKLLEYVWGDKQGTYYGDNPVRMDITAYFQPPKKLKGVVPEYCIGRMDKDNIEKGIMDSLQGIMYDNDKQVVAGETQKRYAPKGVEEYVKVEMRMLGV